MPKPAGRATGPVEQGATDRVAVVTGSSRGLGLSYATALLERGLHVVLNGTTEAPDLGQYGPERAVYIQADVGTSEGADRLIRSAVAAFGRLDVLVNNAGRYRDRTLLKLTDDEFDTVIRTHLYSTFYCSRAAAAVMREQGGGRILNVGSDAVLGSFGQTNYAAAKGGIVSMTLTWALELGRYGIQVNAVFPNAATDPVRAAPGVLERFGYGGGFPRSMGEPRESAQLVVYLACSEAATKITGQVLALGGDRLALWRPSHEQTVAFKVGGWTSQEVEAAIHRVFINQLPAPGFTP